LKRDGGAAAIVSIAVCSRVAGDALAALANGGAMQYVALQSSV
jgi:hypothetical protein